MRSIIALIITFLTVQQIQAQTYAPDSNSLDKWQKTNDHLEYKIIKGKAGKPLLHGNYMQMHVNQFYSGKMDTVLSDTREAVPRIQVFDSTSMPLAYYHILNQLKTGDSITIRILTEHAFKNNIPEIPPFMEKGKYLHTCVKLLNIFASAQQADSADKAEKKMAKPRIYAKLLANIEKEIAANKDKIEADSKLIENFLFRNKVTAQRTPSGTFIAVTKEGVGKQIDNNCLVTINYTGKLMRTGKVVDSNTMPSFNHVEPLKVDMSEPTAVIWGLYESLLQLKKGTKATLYIPSPLAYGSTGVAPLIQPGDILVFEVKILTVQENR